MTHPFDRLLANLAERIRAEDRAEARDTARLYAAAIGQDHKRANPHVHDTRIRDCLKALATPESETVLAAQPYIPWTFSAVLDPSFDRLGSLFAAASLIGPGFGIAAENLRAGLFLQFSDQDYPLHNHSADETYHVLAGTGTWQAGETRTQHAPGQIIHHPSMLPHALRTNTEPVLAAWRWSGNIDPSTYRLLA